jgi:hypothetical protein
MAENECQCDQCKYSRLLEEPSEGKLTRDDLTEETVRLRAEVERLTVENQKKRGEFPGIPS